MHTLTVHKYATTDPRLSRHVEHDSRSWGHAALPKDTKPRGITTSWTSFAPPLDQGKVGACTGNALTDWFNTEFADLFREFQKRGLLVESDALLFYHWATQNDSIKGVYPPNDTGSSGLAVCKGAKKAGWLDSYKHLFSPNSIQAAAELGPWIQGTVWTQQMFKPHNGLVSVGTINDSTVAGGHEYQGGGIAWGGDEVLIYRNSWGDQNKWPGCKPGGYFAIGFGKNHNYDFERLMEAQGDATVPVGRLA